MCVRQGPPAGKVYGGSTATGSALQSLTTAVHPSGTFSVSASSAFLAGVYTARAEQVGDGGGIGRSAPRTFTVDASAAPVVLAAGDIAACDTFGDETPRCWTGWRGR